MILDLYGVPFHAMVVFGHDREFLFNPAWAYCENEPNSSVNLIKEVVVAKRVAVAALWHEVAS